MHKTGGSPVDHNQNVLKLVFIMTNMIVTMDQEDPQLKLEQPLAALDAQNTPFDVRNQVKNN